MMAHKPKHGDKLNSIQLNSELFFGKMAPALASSLVYSLWLYLRYNATIFRSPGPRTCPAA